ncbi:DUF4349 domain-containing protein [Winogradskyella ursingii]|uniref:DUF4349 domain-containing protein n=1 Tax=Winogradskyella ursingii TaxID=2686079 RepID=UPI0015CDBC60|nr:DUF4349 domain-containing protein [Winogradskyella ursingii]
MKFLIALWILALPLACSNNTGSDEYVEKSVAVDEMDLGARSLDDNSIQISEKQQPQKLIKTSFLSFETQDLDKTYKDLASTISKYKGYIQDDASTKGYNQISRRLVVRIPIEDFQNTIDAISSNVEFFDTKQISSKDVTEEFIDLEARLKAKKTLEARYLELLKKANNVKEILEIERELSNIREEIEAKQGRLKYLQNKVSLSTITIEFYKRTTETGVTKSYGSKMWNAIVSGFDGLSVFFLGILYIWPFIIIIIIAFFLIRKWIAKRNKK